MPSVDWNKAKWGSTYAWPEEGNEWSKHWGGTTLLWSQVIFPRIRQFLPAQTILEIGPGFGRFTILLRQYCQRLIGVDVNANCIETCKRKFGDDVQLHVNDGRSLGMIADESIDFVFSFDSLVHVDACDLASYVDELGRKLKPNGAGFIHHSNLGAYPHLRRLTNIVSAIVPSYRVGKWLRQNLLVAGCWRAEDVTADLFAQLCSEHGLACIAQELINWENRSALIDCFSTFIRPNSSDLQSFRRIENRRFMQHAREINRLATLESQGDENFSPG
jgi:ubiquinone/menaquinone biosynthesis C-methylase UbiE